MDNSIFEALQLLVVGMITVFLILTIVIYLGKCLIFFVNKFVSEEVVTTKSVAQTKSVAVDVTTKAVIDAAVSQLTDGKGVVVKIEKI